MKLQRPEYSIKKKLKIINRMDNILLSSGNFSYWQQKVLRARDPEQVSLTVDCTALHSLNVLSA